MASEFIAVGENMHLSIDGGQYVSVGKAGYMRLTRPASLTVRVGHGAQLQARTGQVIRGVTGVLGVAGLVSSPSAAAAFGATKQPLVATWKVDREELPKYGSQTPERFTDWHWDVADTTVPIGLLYPDAANTNSPQWGGVMLDSVVFMPLGPVSATGSNYVGGALGSATTTYTIKLRANTVKYLVSPKPQWQYDAPASLSTGQTGQVRIRVAYPDGEPVVGLQVNVSSVRKNVAFGAGLAFSAMLTTDNNGRAEVSARAVNSGDDAIQIVVSDARCSPDYFSPPLDISIPVNSTVVRVDGVDCVYLPAVDAKPAVPATFAETSTFAWDAGANSEVELDGDVVVEFSGMETVAGAVIGLTDDREAVTDPARIAHGWYFHASGTWAPRVQAYERGKIVSQEWAYDPETVFRIERRGARITYRIGGAAVHTSPTTVMEAVSVGAALFGASDVLFGADATEAED